MSRHALVRLTAALLLASLLGLAGCGGQQATTSTNTTDQEPPAAEQTQPATEATVPPAEPADPALTAEPKGMPKTATKLETTDLKQGTGAEAKKGSAVTVHYTGWLTDGKKFDSSLNSGQPFTFQLGSGQVIPGWDQGVEGMKVGGVRKLVIPADLGYGQQGAGGVIPPGATLVFVVQLRDVK